MRSHIRTDGQARLRMERCIAYRPRVVRQPAKAFAGEAECPGSNLPSLDRRHQYFLTPIRRMETIGSAGEISFAQIRR